MEYFFIDDKRNIKKTYEDLIKDINRIKEFSKFIYTKDVYMIFVKILASLVMGNSIELLDMDLSQNELINMGIDFNNLESVVICENNTAIKDYEELLNTIRDNEYNWKITMYTSGTTGRPKKIAHQLSTLARTVKSSSKFQDDIWAFCYNPTHFAGLQVFLQAFFNRNTIVYTFDYNQKELCNSLIENKVTNISATPTYYRTNLLNANLEMPKTRYVTLGGERFDSDLADKLKDIFPNAKIRNIYASTEAGSLFSSDGEQFKIENDHLNHIKISDNGELLINERLIGNSEDLITKDKWYYTGDIVELVDGNKFKIVSRNTEMVNVGGYKVNPNEVEEEIKKIKGVLDVLVIGRTNKLVGNILIAEIVKEFEFNDIELEKEILRELSVVLQKWKIPRIFKFVEEIERTRTGKKVRK